MIKVNLLDSVTDRVREITVIETKVTNPRTQTWLLASVCLALMTLAMVFDWTSAHAARSAAQRELEKQQQIAVQMAAINREQAELEKKTRDVQGRIGAIQKLRSSQQGPVAVLSEINGRLPQIADFRLESIEQKGGELVIKGDSPSEAAVTQFGHSLEFSSGLFANVTIETQRKTLEGAAAEAAPPLPPPAASNGGNSSSSGDGGGDASAPPPARTPAAPRSAPETVGFTIKCRYTPPSATTPQPSVAEHRIAPVADQVAQKLRALLPAGKAVAWDS